jgi:hypothetical protein
MGDCNHSSLVLLLIYLLPFNSRRVAVIVKAGLTLRATLFQGYFVPTLSAGLNTGGAFRTTLEGRLILYPPSIKLTAWFALRICFGYALRRRGGDGGCGSSCGRCGGTSEEL